MIPTFRRWAVAIGVTAALISVGLEPATATASPATARPTCTLTVPVPKSEDPASCVAVDLSLDKLPTVGETTALRVHLRSQVSVAHAQLTVRVPDTLQLITAGSPLGAPQQVGPWQEAKGVVALDTHGQNLTLHVRAAAAGPAQIEANLSDAGSPAPEREAHTSALITVGAKSSRSGADITSLPGHSGARRSDPASVSKKFAKVPQTTQSTQTTAMAPLVAGQQICISGGFEFTNQAGTWLGGRNLTVKVWGKAYSNSAQQVYASGLTDNSGAYNLCFTLPVDTMYSLYVEFRSESSLWQVTDNNGWVYSTTTPAAYNVSANYYFGWTASAAAQMRAWHAFDTLNLSYWGRNNSTTSCWTAHENANCSKVNVQWWAGNADGGYYVPGANAAASYIRLRDNDPDSEHLEIHESGHALMHQLYNWWWPTANCLGHQIWVALSTSCAWTEGFANAFAGSVKGDNQFVWPNGSSVSLMNTTWFNSNYAVDQNNWQNGDAVEGRVAGSLIDLWNQVDGGGRAATISLLLNHTESTYSQYFLTDRPKAGLDTSNNTRNWVYNHTIDYRTTWLNSSFETNRDSGQTGTAGWNWTATMGGSFVGNWSTYAANTGSNYAWMGGYGAAETETLSQDVMVPSNANSAWIGIYTRILTWEDQQAAYDTFQVQVVDGGVTTTLGTLSNLNASAGYVYRSYSLNAYKGHSVTIKLVSTEDASVVTNFIVDDLSVNSN